MSSIKEKQPELSAATMNLIQVEKNVSDTISNQNQLVTLITSTTNNIDVKNNSSADGSKLLIAKESESVSTSPTPLQSSEITITKTPTESINDDKVAEAASAAAATAASSTTPIIETKTTSTTATDLNASIAKRNLAQITSPDLKSMNASTVETESPLINMLPETSITHITEVVHDYSSDHSNASSASTAIILDEDIDDDDDDLQEVPLSTSDDSEEELTKIGTAAAAEDIESDDHLTPLIIDNHNKILEHHQEIYKPITRLIDVVDRLNEIPEFKPLQRIPPLEKKDSIGSIDSDISSTLSSAGTYDRQSSLDEEQSRTSSGICVVNTTNNGQQQYRPSSMGGNSSIDGSASSDAAGSSDENAKDSGCDVQKKDDDDDLETTPIEIPDDNLSEKICEQVEFYFSNENILKDAFLLKHVRRNKEGFVSLKLISSFKRVRQLTKDWRVVGYAIKRKSVIIQVNDIGTKIRRIEALPVFDETMPSRTVVATDLPVDKLTIEKVSELFSKCGEIAQIRILRPGHSIPADVRQFYNKHPDLHDKECALVEFTESQSARMAQEMEEMQTYEMVAPKKKTGKKAPTSVSKIIENYKYPSYGDAERSRGGDGGSGGGNDFKYGQHNHHQHQHNQHHHHHQQQQLHSHIRRSSSGFYPKHSSDSVTAHNCQFHRKSSYPGNGTTIIQNNGIENCDHYNRRSSNCSIGSASDMLRKFSNCSDGYSSCGDNSRRPSTCGGDSTSSRRQSQCSTTEIPFRRSSSTNCSDFCPCSRRSSQCGNGNTTNSGNGQQQVATTTVGVGNDSFNRRISQCSEHSGRRFSNGSNVIYERRPSIPMDGGRRVSFDNEFANNNNDRKISNGSNGEYHRKFSNGFDQMRKMSSSGGIVDKFFDSRKISSDSGYDRRASIGSMVSDCSGIHQQQQQQMSTSPRSRNGSLTNNSVIQPIVKAETLVRTPIGPDGSKGFSRARKVAQIVSPV